MARHAVALGYFFLAAFCTLASAHSFLEFRVPLLVAAAFALAAGVGYVAGPLAWALRISVGRVRNFGRWIAKMMQLAQQPLSRTSASADETPV